MGEAMQASLGPENAPSHATVTPAVCNLAPHPSRHRNDMSAIGARTSALEPPLSLCPLLVRKDEVFCKLR